MIVEEPGGQLALDLDAQPPDAQEPRSTDGGGDLGRVRMHWKALPWRMYAPCTRCARFCYCAGKARERLVCLDCYAAGGARDRRGGKRGKRAGYAMRVRRPKTETMERTRQLRAQGLTVEAIADRLGLADATVRKYLAKARVSER